MTDWSSGLRVMHEYHTSGIWELEEDGEVGTTLDFEELNLPPTLDDRFRAWIREHGEPFDDSNKHVDSERLMRTGRKLARDLKKFVGESVPVEFQHGREKIKIVL